VKESLIMKVKEPAAAHKTSKLNQNWMDTLPKPTEKRAFFKSPKRQRKVTSERSKTTKPSTEHLELNVSFSSTDKSLLLPSLASNLMLQSPNFLDSSEL